MILPMLRAGTAESYEQRILRAIEHIERNLDEDVGLEDLASVACFSPFHFHRVFRGMTGESVMSFVRRLRLDRAAQQLLSTKAPVTDIAFSAGYDSHEAFTRKFRARFGVPPSEFRESRAPLPGHPAAIHLEVREIPERHYAFIRHFGPYENVGPCWGRLYRWAGMRGLLGPASSPVGMSWDDPDITDTSRIRYDAALEVPAGTLPEGEVGVRHVPAMPYACTRHRGPYSEFSRTYAAVFGGWLPSSGYDPANSPCLEFYRNNPQSCPPEQLTTDVCVPLEPNGR